MAAATAQAALLAIQNSHREAVAGLQAQVSAGVAETKRVQVWAPVLARISACVLTVSGPPCALRVTAQPH